MNTIIQIALGVLLLSPFFTASQNASTAKFEISFPATLEKGPIDGRLLLLVSTNTEDEPRFQISEDLNTQQVFGVDVDGWKPGETKTVDQSAFGYPRLSLAQLPPGEYTVQALLHRYESFKRADGREAEVVFRIAMHLPPRIKRVAANDFTRERRLIAAELIAVNPTHAVLRTNQQLKSSVRDLGRLPELIGELASHPIRFINRRGRPPRAGDV